MSSVVISGDTSGAITLAVPAVAGTNTITLPASTGTVLTTGSTGVCQAWCNFNGVANTIRGSYNISSVTVPTGGRYQFNFTNAMSDTNYAIIGTSDDSASNGSLITLQGSSSITYTTTYFIVQAISNSTPASLASSYTVSVAIFR
jgi:hypothetical protein